MCLAHYHRVRRHGSVGKPLRLRNLPVELVICTWPKCGTEIFQALPDFWVHRDWPFHVIDHKARP
jgi:hypothetical protein